MDYYKPRITLSMLVRNETDRYLARVLTAAREYISDAVIIDDASDDGTPELCRRMLDGVPLRLVQNSEPLFHDEWRARAVQWRETIAVQPDWILFLDADEIFESKFAADIKPLVSDLDCDVLMFRLYDMWDEEHYRDDELWRAHTTYRPFMLRYRQGFDYKIHESRQHCGRMPYNIFGFPYNLSSLRLKHYGWARADDRAAKYRRYMELDPGGVYGSLAQYESILDENVNLVRWNEHE